MSRRRVGNSKRARAVPAWRNSAWLADRRAQTSHLVSRRRATKRDVAEPPGTQIFFQVAWNDTKTKQVRLARPNMNELAPRPPGLMAVLAQIGTKAAQLNQSIQRIPLFRHRF